MASQKYTNRKIKQDAYEQKYGHIPLDYDERLAWMVDHYNLSPAKMDEILLCRTNMLCNMEYYDLDIVSLYEEPEGTGRPRYRIINRQNFHMEAMKNSDFVHVYTLGAKDDHIFMKKMIDNELIALDGLINTPVIIEYLCYYKTPASYNVTRTFMAEMGIDRPGLDKPDWDNAGKKYCDMYNHNVWLDDITVIDGRVRKFYSIKPRVEIKLRYLNAAYNKIQYNRVINRKDYDGTPIAYFNDKGEIVR